MKTRYCARQWTGQVRDHGDPRSSVNVSGRHLCDLPAGHRGGCRCICGAVHTAAEETEETTR